VAIATTATRAARIHAKFSFPLSIIAVSLGWRNPIRFTPRPGSPRRGEGHHRQ